MFFYNVPKSFKFWTVQNFEKKKLEPKNDSFLHSPHPSRTGMRASVEGQGAGEVTMRLDLFVTLCVQLS